MKSRQEILAFLNGKKGKTITDELAIEAYCARHKVKIEFTSTQKCQEAITLSQFEEWFNRKDPDKHSIIVLDESGIIGLVKDIEPNCIVFAAHLTPEGDFIQTDKHFPITPFSEAKSHDMLKLQREFYKHNISWNKHNSIIQESIILTENLHVRVSVLGNKIGLGVFREVDDKGIVVMYIYYQLKDNIRYSLYEPIGKIQDFQFDHSNIVERKILNEELAKLGKTWNGHSIRLEPSGYRVDKGQKYYYIDNTLIIREVTEMDKQKDGRHFRCGNYFRTYEEGVLILEKVDKFLTDYPNRQEPDKYRVAKGEMFFSVDDYFTVREIEEKCQPKDLELFRSGNYFRHRSDAVGLLEILISEIKILLSKPENIIPEKKRGKMK